MNCDTALELLSAMLDGGLTDTEAERLQSHLAACESCRAVYDELVMIDAAVRDDQAEPPDALRENVMTAIRAEQRQKTTRKTRSWLLLGIAAAAALALIILSGTGVLPLPGTGEAGRVSVSVGQSMQAILPPETPGTEGLEAKYAAQIATENGCVVLAVWQCGELEELSGAGFETLDDGAKLYAVDGATVDAILKRCREQYPMGLYYPEGACETGENALAYVMIYS